jgi:uncharacterized membrane protein YukC
MTLGSRDDNFAVSLTETSKHSQNRQPKKHLKIRWNDLGWILLSVLFLAYFQYAIVRAFSSVRPSVTASSP